MFEHSIIQLISKGSRDRSLEYEVCKFIGKILPFMNICIIISFIQAALTELEELKHIIPKESLVYFIMGKVRFYMTFFTFLRYWYTLYEMKNEMGECVPLTIDI